MLKPKKRDRCARKSWPTTIGISRIPDLTPLVIDETLLEQIVKELPEMPAARKVRYINEMGLPEYDAGILTEERPVADYFEATVDALKESHPDDTAEAAKAVSNFVMTDVLRVVNERRLDVTSFPIEPVRLAGLVHLRMQNKISSSGAHELFELILESKEDPEKLAAEHNLLQISDAGALLPVINKILEENPKQLSTYLNGKEGLIGYFIGQVMRSFPGSPDPKMVKSIILERIEEMR